jgi:hypothetical protein
MTKKVQVHKTNVVYVEVDGQQYKLSDEDSQWWEQQGMPSEVEIEMDDRKRVEDETCDTGMPNDNYSKPKLSGGNVVIVKETEAGRGIRKMAEELYKDNPEQLQRYMNMPAINLSEQPVPETIEQAAEREAEGRYPVLTHSNPENSPYKGTKETFKHGVRFGVAWKEQQLVVGNQKKFDEQDMSKSFEAGRVKGKEESIPDDGPAFGGYFKGVRFDKWLEQYIKDKNIK